MSTLELISFVVWIHRWFCLVKQPCVAANSLYSCFRFVTIGHNPNIHLVLLLVIQALLRIFTSIEGGVLIKVVLRIVSVLVLSCSLVTSLLPQVVTLPHRWLH
jgi:hypothetical protein